MPGYMNVQWGMTYRDRHWWLRLDSRFMNSALQMWTLMVEQLFLLSCDNGVKNIVFYCENAKVCASPGKTEQNGTTTKRIALIYKCSKAFHFQNCSKEFQQWSKIKLIHTKCRSMENLENHQALCFVHSHIATNWNSVFEIVRYQERAQDYDHY